MNPSEACLLTPDELEHSPEAHKIRNLAAWGKGIIILPRGWELLISDGLALTDEQAQYVRSQTHGVFEYAIKDATPTPDVGHKGTVAGTGGGLNRFGRTSLTADDCQYITDHLPSEVEVWDFNGEKYTKSTE